MEFASQFLLWLEAVVLVYCTASAGTGLYLLVASFGPAGITTAPLIRGITIVMALAGLISGWRLLIAFLFGNRLTARGVWRGWWYAASTAASAAVASLIALVIAYWSATDVSADLIFGSGLGFLAVGIVFLPTYLHLAAEVWLRRV
jgi:hypothetical protein